MGFREFEISLDKLRKRVDRLPKLALNIMTVELLRIGNIAARRAADLTPRSGGPTVATADRWVARQRKGKRGTTVRVFNTLPKANREIPLEGGGTTTLLEILEFGSAPHEIRPKNKKFLRFVIDGQVIFTKGPVFHPGIAPHNMMTIASVEAAANTKLMIDSLRNFIRKHLTALAP